MHNVCIRTSEEINKQRLEVGERVWYARFCNRIRNCNKGHELEFLYKKYIEEKYCEDELLDLSDEYYWGYYEGIFSALEWVCGEDIYDMHYPDFPIAEMIKLKLNN